MKTTKLILGLALVLMTFSCSKDDNSSSSSDAKTESTIDLITDDISKIVDDQFNVQQGLSGRSTDSYTSFLPSCAVSTVVVDGTTWTRTVVFTNCTMPNGNVLDGTIIVSGSTDFSQPSQTISYSFVNFHHNNILVEGNRTVVRTLASTAALAAIHPVANVAIDMTLTFPNGSSHHRVGNRIREMIQGYNTPGIWLDNIYSVTGSWTTTFPSGTQTSTIATPLIVKMSCPNIVSGVINFVRNSNTGSIDYGNGDCDNIAVVTINGVEHTIILGN